jgi:ferredoxin
MIDDEHEVNSEEVIVKPKRTRTKKNHPHYVCNKDMTEALSAYVLIANECKKNGTRPPRIPNYIGECIMRIAYRLGNKSNFGGYTYKDEMICDGIENCLRYIDRFNPEKSQNAFAYATQIISMAMIRRIKAEKKQSQIKQKSLENICILDSVSETQVGDDRKYQNQYTDTLSNHASHNAMYKSD